MYSKLKCFSGQVKTAGSKDPSLALKSKLAPVKKADLDCLDINLLVPSSRLCLPYHSFTLTILCKEMHSSSVYAITLISSHKFTKITHLYIVLTVNIILIWKRLLFTRRFRVLYLDQGQFSKWTQGAGD